VQTLKMTRTILSNHGITKAWWKSAVVYQVCASNKLHMEND
jgi:hypothetical protein